ncbi:MAG: flotillin family protein [Deltaproteobacteria bacterium]|nr:flotillin family protein [Deltaproteobacteria bacterium]
MELIGIPLVVLLVTLGVGISGLMRLIHICAPNEVLIFSGKVLRVADRVIGYRLIKGGRGIRVPLLERVDKLDLTNMVIDVTAKAAYTKAGVPLTVQGSANVKIAGHEPLLNNAIERFVGKPRAEVMQVAKATLEGTLRGVLATMTPEQVSGDRIMFAEKLVQQVEHDMTSLGLVVDTLKIQNVHDEVGYLEAIGRKKNAEVLRRARIAEASARSDAVVRTAENKEREAKVRFAAETTTRRAEAHQRLTDALTRRDALIAEERAKVAAMVAQAKAELDVQKARIEQVRRRLEAEVIQPAKANCTAAEEAAKANAAPIIEEGRARAEVLRTLAGSWAKAGPNARELFLLQKLDGVIGILTDMIGSTAIDKVTMIDSRAPSLGDGSLPIKSLATLEQVKQIFGVDVLEKLKGAATTAAPSSTHPAPLPRPVQGTSPPPTAAARPTGAPK